MSEALTQQFDRLRARVLENDRTVTDALIELGARVGRLETKVSRVDARLGVVELSLEEVATRLDAVDGKLDRALDGIVEIRNLLRDRAVGE